MTDYKRIWKVEKQEPKRFKEGTKSKSTDDTPESCFRPVAPLRWTVMREMVSQYMKTHRSAADGKLWTVPSQEELETAFICIPKMAFLYWNKSPELTCKTNLSKNDHYKSRRSFHSVFIGSIYILYVFHLNALSCHYGAAVALSDSDNMGWTIRGVREASLLPNIQTGSKAQPASHSMFTGVPSQE